MVRLKACQRFFYRIICKISIPYGAIKSNENYQPADDENVFQFLMVRLKEENLNYSAKQLLNFNSLWCD